VKKNFFKVDHAPEPQTAESQVCQNNFGIPHMLTPFDLERLNLEVYTVHASSTHAVEAIFVPPNVRSCRIKHN